MLKRTHPDIVVLTEQLEHTNFLLDKTIPFCRTKEREGVLDFDTICRDSGRRCLIGWHQHLDPDFQPSGVRRIFGYQGGLPRYWEAVTRYFGLYTDEWRMIFGSSESGNLDQRERYARRILKPRLERRLAAMLDAGVEAPSPTREPGQTPRQPRPSARAAEDRHMAI